MSSFTRSVSSAVTFSLPVISALSRLITNRRRLIADCSGKHRSTFFRNCCYSRLFSETVVVLMCSPMLGRPPPCPLAMCPHRNKTRASFIIKYLSLCVHSPEHYYQIIPGITSAIWLRLFSGTPQIPFFLIILQLSSFVIQSQYFIITLIIFVR
jgi:hypothetical protein